jgi:heme oxygenase
MSLDVIAADLIERLRTTTSSAHQRLERDLNLLEPPISCGRITEVLIRFYGFYVVWEAALERHSEIRPIFAKRYKLDKLKHDLQMLGVKHIEGLPVCPDVQELCASLSHTVGAMYVVEGSTLGGQIITRALRNLTWVPEGGLTFFDPYGPSTGAMWLAFKDWARTTCPESEWMAAEQGAQATFSLLHRWLTPGLPT